MRSLSCSALVVLSSLLLAVACGDSPEPEATAAPAPGFATPDAGGGEGCATQGTGTLTLEITGAPGKVTVAIEGPGGKREIEAPGSVTVPAGTYAVTGARATDGAAVAKVVYAPSPASASVCVKDGASANVALSYAAVPASGKLWMLAGEAVTSFAASTLAGTSRQAGTSLVTVAKATALAFERDGSLWVAAGSTLRHHPAANLATADVTLDVPAATAKDVDAIGGIAFDAAGNLWYAATAEGKVRRVAAADLRASGAITKYVTLGGLTQPSTIVFDGSGNLWVADKGDRGINRFSAASLTANQDAPSLMIAPHALTGNPDANRILTPFAIAFDPAGALWAFYGYCLVRIEPKDLTNGDPTPAIQIEVNSTASLDDRIAFDAEGGLWFTYELATGGAEPTPATFARLAPGQLTAASSESVEPERVITVTEPAGFESTRQLVFFTGR